MDLLQLDKLTEIGNSCHKHAAEREERLHGEHARMVGALDRYVECHGRILHALEGLDTTVKKQPVE
jgi:hypothetical protein